MKTSVNIRTECDRCDHREVCKLSDRFLEIIEEIASDVPLKESSENFEVDMVIFCRHYIQP